MSEYAVLNASVRTQTGKGAASALRREKKIPAVIYGGSDEEMLIHLDEREFNTELQKGNLLSRLVDLKIDAKPHRVLTRELQLNPLTDAVEHIDFQRLSPTKPLRVKIPVHFTNQEKCPGLKRGGVLNIVRHKIELLCKSHVPKEFSIDLSTAMIGDSIHISHIKLPEGVTPTISNRDFTIATITGRMAEEAATATGAAEALPEAASE